MLKMLFYIFVINYNFEKKKNLKKNLDDSMQKHLHLLIF